MDICGRFNGRTSLVLDNAGPTKLVGPISGKIVYTVSYKQRIFLSLKLNYNLNLLICCFKDMVK